MKKSINFYFCVTTHNYRTRYCILEFLLYFGCPSFFSKQNLFIVTGLMGVLRICVLAIVG